jgi:hypothetical protein
MAGPTGAVLVRGVLGDEPVSSMITANAATRVMFLNTRPMLLTF